MKPEVRNAAIILRSYERWRDSKASDQECWIDIMADRFRTSSAGGGVDRPGYFRPAVTLGELRDYLAGVHREWRMELFDVMETIAQDDRVVARISCTWTNRRTGKAFSVEKLDYFRLRDGKIVEFLECFDTAAMEEARREKPVDILF